jgi:aminoglycoside phosphotransferase (APT) family kinase protein
MWLFPAARYARFMSPTELVLLGEGVEAEVFLRGDGSVLKLLRDPAWASRADGEAAILRVLGSHGYPAPAVIDVVTVDGRPGLVMSRVQGTDLLTQLGRMPLALLRAARVLGDVHASMHQIAAPAQLPDVKDSLRRRIEAAPNLPAGLRTECLALLAELPAGDRLCHGDMHLGNMLGSWSAPVVIDWGNASRGDLHADVARTYLLHWVPVPPPGAAPLIRLLAPVASKALAARYLATYGKHYQVGRQLFGRWLAVNAAARLAEPIPPGHAQLISIIERELHRAP